MDERMKLQVEIESDKWRDPAIYTKDLDERGRKLQSVVRSTSRLWVTADQTGSSPDK